MYLGAFHEFGSTKKLSWDFIFLFFFIVDANQFYSFLRQSIELRVISHFGLASTEVKVGHFSRDIIDVFLDFKVLNFSKGVLKF